MLCISWILEGGDAPQQLSEGPTKEERIHQSETFVRYSIVYSQI